MDNQGVRISTNGHLILFFAGNTTNMSLIYQLARNTSKVGDGNFVFGFGTDGSMKREKEEV